MTGQQATTEQNSALTEAARDKLERLLEATRRLYEDDWRGRIDATCGNEQCAITGVAIDVTEYGHAKLAHVLRCPSCAGPLIPSRAQRAPRKR